MKIYTIIFLVVAIASLVCGITPYAEAEDSLKVGYIDLSKIFDQYTKTQVSSLALEEEGKARQEDEAKMRAEIRRLKDELELLSEKGKEKKLAEIDTKIKQLKDFIEESRNELTGKTRSIMREIMEDIETVIEEYGKSKNYDLVLNDNSVLPYSHRAVLYHHESMDLTNEIIKILNAKYKEK